MLAVRQAIPRFYPIVNVAGETTPELERSRRLALAIAEAGATILQLRAKPLGAGAFTELCAELVGPLRRLGCALIVNDRVDVAAAIGAAGVHLGDADLPVAAARAILGPDAVIGFSTHDVEAIRRAPREATYLAFGPVFDSTTKAGVRSPRGLDALHRACRESDRPVVAIGGITLAEAAAVWGAGAASAAVISDLETSKDPLGRVRDWLAAAAAFNASQ